MLELQVCRRKLAGWLSDCAQARRLACDGRAASGEDLKVIARLERLAETAGDLDPPVFGMLQHMLADRATAKRLMRRRRDLLAQVGVTVWPENARELVRWMIGQTAGSEPAVTAGPAAIVTPTPSGATDGIGRRPCRGGGAPAEQPALHWSFLYNLSAGLGIVAPLLAVWEIGDGIGQWRDGAIVRASPATTATIVSGIDLSSRSLAPPSQVDISFRPSPQAAPCRVSLRLHGALATPEAGQPLVVVPRSEDCEVPLVPSQIGDPATTFMVAAALMAVGLASMRLWSLIWMRGLASRHAGRPASLSDVSPLASAPWNRARSSP